VAKKLGVTFAPEDSPDGVLLAIAGRCKMQMAQTLQQVTESVAAKPGDVDRLQKAQADLAAARQMALQFGLDVNFIEQKAVWVQQAALSAGAGALAQAQFQAKSSPAVDPKRQEGLDKLDRARLELRAASYASARKLAEDAWKGPYGVQKEAEAVLHDIGAEEYNQRLLDAQRTFDAGVDAYTHGEFPRAASILANVDIMLLPPAQQQRMREMMSTRELQPQALAQVDHKVPLVPNHIDSSPPGVAVAGDEPDDALTNVKAMETIQFQQMSARDSQAMKSAMDLFKAGQKMKAVDVLNDQLGQIELSQMSPDATRRLKEPLERRLSEFRMVMAQELLSDQRKGLDKKLQWDEGKHLKEIKDRQDQVGELIKQCQALSKEGKYKESLALAYKAKELDPDNVSAGAFITMTNIVINQKRSDDANAETAKSFLDMTVWGPGPIPTDENPVHMSADGLKRFRDRAKYSPGAAIWQQTKNPKERAIEYRLEQPIQFGFKDTPLREVIDSLCKLSGVPIYHDEMALQQANIGLDHLLTMDCPGLAMKSAMNILLEKVGLAYVIRNESLMITTADKAKAGFKQVVYPVSDLIVPVEDHPIPDVFNIQAVLERQMANQSMMQNYMGASPANPNTMQLPPAPPVSSYGSGLASAFGSMSQGHPQVATSPSTAMQRRAPRQTMEDLLMDLIKGTIQPHTWKDMGGPGTVQYYPLGMAMIINQTQEVQGEIVDLLAALRRLLDLEVSIEMRLVSVSESFYERIGVDFDINLQTTPGNGVPGASPGVQNQLLNSSFTPFGTINKNLFFRNVLTGLTPAGTLTPDLGIPIRNSSFNFSVPPFGGYTAPGVDGGLSLGLAFLSDIQVFMILEAAQGDSRTNVMQAPKITVFNGQTAFISVSVTQFVNLGITYVPVNGQFIVVPNNTGIPIQVQNLQVTPVVSADRRFVRLNLSPTMANRIGNEIPLFPVQIPLPNIVEGPLGQGIQVGQPVINTTFLIQQPAVSIIQLNTTVNVPDGGTVLLGGIKTMSEGRNEAGPPILDKIPYLDRLFRNVGWGREGQSLMIMVTPRIIINEEEERIFLGQEAPIPRQ
jgi:type II secretory pathway component GspD/PulD (secretin)